MFISGDLQAELHSWFLAVVSSNAFLQVAPFVVLFGIPALVFSLAPTAKRVFEVLTYNTFMVLESLGLRFPFTWGPAGPSTSNIRDGEKRKGKKRHPRTRAEQVAQSGVESSVDDGAECYPGLVNMSGTYCFMNSTLQAMASLSYLQPQIDAIHAQAELLDVPSPVIDALQALFDGTPPSHVN
ncbi:hypothetical protein HGRIS_009292 [Hohenbuehelia grisea]|uniref:Peptidase C19 ubiquitin carboxyl-terminal hydrolase domain-containing protein n=1 Tax=Hohenbuehelia grisea TaxID=104357 RepID=A0ABR3J0V4_9AGAR